MSVTHNFAHVSNNIIVFLRFIFELVPYVFLQLQNLQQFSLFEVQVTMLH